MWKEVMAAKEAAAASERAKRIGFLAHGGSLPPSVCLPGLREGSRSTRPHFPTLCGIAAV